MSNLENKLAYISDTKLAIKEAIRNKGITVNENDTFRSYADKINNIETSVVINKIGKENRMMYHKVNKGGSYIYTSTQITGAVPEADYVLFSTSYRQSATAGCTIYNRQTGKYMEFEATPIIVEYNQNAVLIFTDITKIYDKEFNLVTEIAAYSGNTPKVFTNGIMWITGQMQQTFVNLNDYSVKKVSVSLSNSTYYNSCGRIMLDDDHYLYCPYSNGTYLIDLKTQSVVWQNSGNSYHSETSVNGACFQSVYGDTRYPVDNFIISLSNSLYGWNSVTKTMDKIYTGTASIQGSYSISKVNKETGKNELLFETTYGSTSNYIVCRYINGELDIIAQYNKDERTERGFPNAYYNQILFVSRGYYKGGSFVFFPAMQASTYAYYTRVVEKDNYLFIITSNGTMYVGDKYLNTIREVLQNVNIDPFEYPEHLKCYKINGAYVILAEDDRVDYCTDPGSENGGNNNRVVVYCPTTEIATQYHIRDTKSTMGNFTTFSMNIIGFDDGFYLVPREIQHGELDGTMGDYDTRARKVLKIKCDSSSSSQEECDYRGGTRIAKGLYVLGSAWTSENKETEVIVTDYSNPNEVEMKQFERVNTVTYLHDFDWWNMRNYLLEAKDQHQNLIYMFGKDPEEKEELE